tara:strand:+ start:305 stop:814 length:510 start_codon:yes stop_codon:yes gene_type:complete
MKWIDSDYWNNIDVPPNEVLDNQVVNTTALTYSNIIHEKIIIGLTNLLNQEFKTPVLFDEHKGNQSFLLMDQSDSLVAYLSNAEHREFSLTVQYRLKQPSYGHSVNTLNAVSLKMERLRKLIFTNRTLNNGADWFDARIESVEYLKDEEDDNFILSDAEFVCSSIILGS